MGLCYHTLRMRIGSSVFIIMITKAYWRPWRPMFLWFSFWIDDHLVWIILSTELGHSFWFHSSLQSWCCMIVLYHQQYCYYLLSWSSPLSYIWIYTCIYLSCKTTMSHQGEWLAKPKNGVILAGIVICKLFKGCYGWPLPTQEISRNLAMSTPDG